MPRRPIYDANEELQPTYIREWREFRRLTLAEVGRAIGLTVSALSRLERGETPFTQIHLQRLSRVLRCSIVALLTKPPRPSVWTVPGERSFRFDFTQA
jgi:transcriptional regulator with XRE-family HTH domain